MKIVNRICIPHLCIFLLQGNHPCISCIGYHRHGNKCGTPRHSVVLCDGLSPIHRGHVLPAPSDVVRLWRTMPDKWHVDSTHYQKTLLMRITWMPRLCIPMKDVASCDKLRSAARQALPAEDFRMGKPRESYVSRSRIRGKVTR